MENNRIYILDAHSGSIRVVACDAKLQIEIALDFDLFVIVESEKTDSLDILNKTYSLTGPPVGEELLNSEILYSARNAIGDFVCV